MEWEEGLLRPILHYGRVGSLTHVEAELGRKSQEEWGLLSGRLGVAPGNWSLRLMYNDEHISFTDPLPDGDRKAFAARDSCGGVLVGDVGRQIGLSAFMCVTFPIPAARATWQGPNGGVAGRWASLGLCRHRPAPGGGLVRVDV